MLFSLTLSRRKREFCSTLDREPVLSEAEGSSFDRRRSLRIETTHEPGRAKGNGDRRWYPTLFGWEKWKRLAYFTVRYDLSSAFCAVSSPYPNPSSPQRRRVQRDLSFQTLPSTPSAPPRCNIRLPG